MESHKDHAEHLKLVAIVRDCIAGQHRIHEKGEAYLPMTSGMSARNTADENGKNYGLLQYNAYKAKARFPDLAQSTENGIIGLAFEKDPEVNTPFADDIVTNNGRDILSLARTELREAQETGRGVMVVDAPIEGGDPYITEYKSEDFIDHAVADDDSSKLTMAKMREVVYASDDKYKRKPITQYREYELMDGVVTVSVLDEQEILVDEPITLPLGYIPVFIAGSVDNMPDYDPIPMLPICEAAIAIYQISADYRQYMHGHWQGTPYGTGLTEAEAAAIFTNGLGVGSFMSAGESQARFGIMGGADGASSAPAFREAMSDEMSIAERYAVAITSEGAGVESAESMKLRAATQHATVYTILNSVSSAITSAVQCMAEWSGKPSDVVFKLSTDFSSTNASDQMINAVNAAINAGNMPKSNMYQLSRDAGLTDKTDEEQAGEILDSGGAA